RKIIGFKADKNESRFSQSLVQAAGASSKGAHCLPQFLVRVFDCHDAGFPPLQLISFSGTFAFWRLPHSGVRLGLFGDLWLGSGPVQTQLLRLLRVLVALYRCASATRLQSERAVNVSNDGENDER